MLHGSQICKFNTTGQEDTSQGPDLSCSIHVTVKHPAGTTAASSINTLMAGAATFHYHWSQWTFISYSQAAEKINVMDSKQNGTSLAYRI
jgi:hypothetical protein